MGAGTGAALHLRRPLKASDCDCEGIKWSRRGTSVSGLGKGDLPNPHTHARPCTLLSAPQNSRNNRFTGAHVKIQIPRPHSRDLDPAGMIGSGNLHFRQMPRWPCCRCSSSLDPSRTPHWERCKWGSRVEVLGTAGRGRGVWRAPFLICIQDLN